MVAPTFYVEYHKKFSIPMICLIFVIIGMPLGITFKRSGKGMSFGSAVIIIFFYYAFLTLGEALGKKNIINPSFSMWLPNAVIFIFGMFFFYRRAKE